MTRGGKSPLKELLTKLRWDPKEKPEEYTIAFIDLGKLREVPYKALKRIEGTFLILDLKGKETEVPMHRVRKVKRNKKVVWERKV